MSSLCFHNGTVLTGVSKFSNGAVLVKNDLIEDVYNEERFHEKPYPDDTLMIDVNGAYIAPGLIDTHIHGIGGFATEDVSQESIHKMASLLPKYGITSFLPTLCPIGTVEVITQAIKEISAAIKNQENLKAAAIAGMHLEGPFISPKQAGVQKPEYMQIPNIDLMQKFLDAAGEGNIVNMTVAPELKNMRTLALFCLRNNIVLQAGHTDAHYENIKEGMQVGILHATHMFNAMSYLHHRNPGAVGGILIHDEMSCEIIADGHHVHPDVIKLLLQNKPVEKIVLISDSLKTTKQKTPPFFANGEEVYLKDDFFHRKKDDVIAGSSLTMIKGVENLNSYGISLQSAVQMASHNPARIFNLKKRGALFPGNYADIVVFNKNFEVQYTTVRGTVAYKKEH